MLNIVTTEIIVASIAALSSIAVALLSLNRKDSSHISKLKELVAIREAIANAEAPNNESHPATSDHRPSSTITPSSKRSLDLLESSIEVTASRVEHDTIRAAFYRRPLGAVITTLLLLPSGVILITFGSALLANVATELGDRINIGNLITGLMMATIGLLTFTVGLFSWDASVKRRALASIPANRDFPRNFIDLLDRRIVGTAGANSLDVERTGKLLDKDEIPEAKRTNWLRSNLDQLL